MITRWAHLRGGRAARSGEGGYVAVMTALMLFVFMGFAAFAVDAGHWYLVGQQEQRAADAAAMAGVTYLPADPTSAYATAQTFSKVNGFTNGVNAVSVVAGLNGQPNRLRVTVSQTVSNFFGSLLGAPTTAVSRTAVADYAGPVPMGSPCNEFGDDPLAGGNESTNCNGVPGVFTPGQFWANVGSLPALKSYGDAFQDNVCEGFDDGCTGSTNTDYSANGYFYSVTLTKAVANLTIQAFDPALIDVGDFCGASGKPDPGNLIGAKAILPAHTVYGDPVTRYANGATSYCTGDIRYGGTGDVATQFTVRSPGPNSWDPTSFPPIAGCKTTFAGFSGDLSKALDTTNGAFNTTVAHEFRQWMPLCTITNAQPGTYMIQVNTNGLIPNHDLASGHNRFSLRAFGGSSADNDAIAVAGYTNMALYANTPAGTTQFYLAKVPSTAAGQTLIVQLYDIGDGSTAGSTVSVLQPAETNAAAPFSNCVGAGVTNGPLTGCGFNVNSTYNGKWQTVSVPIPATYTCNDASSTGCWVGLSLFYGPGSTPNDTTSWTASIVGDPVRLVQ